jgi:hypothetical protein
MVHVESLMLWLFPLSQYCKQWLLSHFYRWLVEFLRFSILIFLNIVICEGKNGYKSEGENNLFISIHYLEKGHSLHPYAHKYTHLPKNLGGFLVRFVFAMPPDNSILIFAL